MNAPRPIPYDVLARQTETSDPRISAWVAANAGSGKTYVLAQRVIRLMLDGADPSKILCLTFTKAAAANMANQIFARLAEWTALDDDALDETIERMEGEPPGRVRRERARRLFAQALETPGGLKVQTIHAFCTRLLHQFPFEADVAARFAVLEERAERDLLARLRLAVLLEAAGAPESALGRALAKAIEIATDRTFGDVIDEAIRERDRLSAWIAHAGSTDAAIVQLSGTLGITPGDAVEAVEAAMVESPILPAAQWPAVAAALQQGSSNDRKCAENLTRASAATGVIRRDAYLRVFFKMDDEPRERVVTKGFETREPELAARLMAEQARLIQLMTRRRACLARDRTAALVTVAHEVIGRYRAEKQWRGLLDYDDLIDKTLSMMERVDAAWVHYKLDLGVDHVLIDEAQDTSPKQWEIVKRLAAEFTAGAGARGGVRRTIFAVGDEKQSIFSFQGAAPREFTEARSHFERRCRDAELSFQASHFAHSFRSGCNVLGAVDHVFARKEIFASVTTDDAGVPPHSALPDAPPGMVEMWPLIEAQKRQEIEGWDAPFDEVSEESPQAKLATRIAAQIKVLRTQGHKPGDVLILVRQRGPLFETIIRILKNAGIPVAGADRLVLTEHIAVMDLMALADALLLPDDDLALATVLKSPLFGLNDDQLFDFAYGRKTNLRSALRAKAGEDLFYADAEILLERLEQAARQDAPFAFYARLLGAEHGRKKFLARLGGEAADALDEFLNLALDYEARETPSLQGFVAWLRAASSEVKRDMDIVRDEVRVMTVHGAKGLEAPVVILADTTTRPTGPRDPRLLYLPRKGVAPGTPDCLVWAGAKATDLPPIAQARIEARRETEDEYRRLLYVAMTRAAERLIVCGAQGLIRRPANCWYDLIVGALWDNAHEEPADHGDDTVRRWRIQEGEVPAQLALAVDLSDIEVPEWLTRPMPAVSPARTVAPSSALEPTPRRNGSGGEAQLNALTRGRLMHRLLQALPDIAAERRAEAADRHLSRASLSEAERTAIAGQVTALLQHPVFAPLFGPGTRAEVPIVGRIARPGRPPLTISGQVDRLAVTPDVILLADYKTDRPAPRSIEDVPEAYVAQLALYRAVLQRLYPGREVRAALIFTKGPTLIEPSATVLDNALITLP